MDDSERRSAKRSRFDQTEPEPRRHSRFDRRSRSPPATKREPGRDRSPLSGTRDVRSETPDHKPAIDPAAAAAAAAAKINAQLQARKGIQHVDVPPIRSSSATAKDGSTTPAKINGEVYISDGDYIKDIEVNDLRNRYLLTKSSTQKMIKEETGADVTTRGAYLPDKSMATPINPPLYLHVTSTTKEGLDKAVAKIEELKQQELPQLVDERRFRRRDQEQQQPPREREDRRVPWPEERIPINLESVPGFNLRAQIVGSGGSYVKHIQNETNCRVQIKGRGSGYWEGQSGQESDDDMYLHVAGADPENVKRAKELCEDLLANVKQELEDYKNRPPRNNYGDRGGYGDRPNRGPNNHSNNSYQGYNNNSHHQNNAHNYGNSAAPTAASTSPTTPAGNPTAAADYASQYAQYAQYYGGGDQNGAADPYAAYGGYEAYYAMYQQWYAAQNPVAAAPPGMSALAPPPPLEAAPPPPPPSVAAPPPPPPGGPSRTGGYNAVPPPPGL
ncbi:hypothetical protein B0T26DRAFT_468153 [Lasiosphaeria miniovina]|uniref:K Homology domain-containing protein n=1 Tax=Lasiosphaeria miniovina TaxID=1954250 RepID=A0AA40DMI0_9PEZI|nr:uncharacterized protein B0T26DRAFT_468153 [Lasiosphaeria miniovina]KAK0706701.1 hypothetical protein B0T26DRAFT_468153 [Lasiosphaeria miniovina]